MELTNLLEVVFACLINTFLTCIWKKKAKGPKTEKAIIDKSKITSLISRLNQSEGTPLLTTSIKASITAIKTQIEKIKLIIDKSGKSHFWI